MRFVCEKQFLRSRRASRREREFARVWISPHTPLVCVSDIELKNMRDACPYLARDTLCYSLCIENRGLPISFLGGRGADLYAPIKLRFNHNMRHFAFPRVGSLFRDTKLIYTPALREAIKVQLFLICPFHLRFVARLQLWKLAQSAGPTRAFASREAKNSIRTVKIGINLFLWCCCMALAGGRAGFMTIIISIFQAT